MVHEWFDSKVQIGLISEEDFRSNLPKYFKHGVSSKIRFDKNHVNVLAGNLHPSSPFEASSFPQEMLIDSQETLVDMKRQLLTLPTFMPYQLRDKRTFCDTNNYIIFINPKHPRIRENLEKSFNLCLEKLSRAEHFAMEIRLDNAMRAYCNRTSHNLQKSVPYNTPYICVTNSSSKCQEFYQPCVWVLCCPCAVLLGIPYCLCRGCTTQDFECQIMGDVTHVGHHTDHRPASHITLRQESEDATTRSVHGFSSHQLPTISKSSFQAHGNDAFEAKHHAWHDSESSTSALVDHQSPYTESSNDPYQGYKGQVSSEEQSPNKDPYKGRVSSVDLEPHHDPYKGYKEGYS